MGWGQPIVEAVEVRVGRLERDLERAHQLGRAAARLAAAVRCWESNRTTGNAERMVVALEAVERRLVGP